MPRPNLEAWTYNGLPVGPEIRVTEGETVRVTVFNDLPEPTTLHWHGLPIPNAMGGVPGVTQPAIAPGDSFVYEFPAWPSGTYWYHSHVAYQLDRGLIGPLIVEPKQEAGDYDREYTLVLDDWVAVNGGPPEARSASSSGGMMGRGPGRGMGPGMMGRGRGGMMGGRRDLSQPEGEIPLQEPIYQAFTVNRLVADAASPLPVKQGERVRLRLINAAGATIFALRLAGHPLTLTHADGRPLEPLEIDLLRLGPGERYDLTFTANNPGRWDLYDLGLTGGPGNSPLAIFQYGTQRNSQPSGDTMGRNFRWNDYRLLRGQPEDGLPMAITSQEESRVFNMLLSGGHMSPYWTINGKVYPDTDTVVVSRGERVRFNYFNQSPMAHPMHLHG